MTGSGHPIERRTASSRTTIRIVPMRMSMGRIADAEGKFE